MSANHMIDYMSKNLIQKIKKEKFYLSLAINDKKFSKLGAILVASSSVYMAANHAQYFFLLGNLLTIFIIVRNYKLYKFIYEGN